MIKQNRSGKLHMSYGDKKKKKVSKDLPKRLRDHLKVDTTNMKSREEDDYFPRHVIHRR